MLIRNTIPEPGALLQNGIAAAVAEIQTAQQFLTDGERFDPAALAAINVAAVRTLFLTELAAACDPVRFEAYQLAAGIQQGVERMPTLVLADVRVQPLPLGALIAGRTLFTAIRMIAAGIGPLVGVRARGRYIKGFAPEPTLP